MYTIPSYLQALASDHQSGSTKVLENLEEALGSYFREHPLVEKEVFHQIIAYCLQHWGQFAVVVHFLNELCHAQPVDNEAFSYQSFLDKYKQHWLPQEGWPARVFNSVQNISESTILLHSNSSTVVRLFDQWTSQGIGENSRIFQSISHPEREGEKQGEALQSQGWKVIMIEDSVMGKMLTQCDLVILGSDVITRSTFVNKVGSMAITAAAYLLKVPVYVLGEERKLVNDKNLPPLLEERMLNEEPKNAGGLNVQVDITGLNYYFEHTPNNWVNGFILNEAVLNHNQIEKRAMGHTYGEELLTIAQKMGT